MTITTYDTSTATLSEAAMQEFLHKASLINHDKELLSGGEEITSYFQLHNFDITRQVLSNATAAQHQERLPLFYSAAYLQRARLGQGRHDRGEAVLFAGAPVSEQDATGINRHFPICVKGISVLHKVVPKGTTWDVTMPQHIWNLGEMEELYTIVNIGTLVLEEGARVVIRGNVFSLLCQQLIVCDNATDNSGYQLGILPTPFSVDFGHGPQSGAHGQPGVSGHNGHDGIPGFTASGTLGSWVPDQHFDQLHGTDAGNGGYGADGGKGRNGGMCKLAEITIRSLQGQLHLFTQAGAGGDGGNGGNGGDGGYGGHGAPALHGFNLSVPGGNAGCGGNGGNGGRGGNAGHGGIASNIYLHVPEAAAEQVRITALDSIGGTGGKGGSAGLAGKSGTVAPAAAIALTGKEATGGVNGIPGRDGQNGRGRTAAVCYLNNQPYQTFFSSFK